MATDGKSAGAELISIVRTFAEEWGVENILIAVPLEWEQIGEALTADEQMRLAFTTNGKIEVSAYEGTFRRVHYAVDSELIVSEALATQGIAA